MQAKGSKRRRRVILAPFFCKSSCSLQSRPSCPASTRFQRKREGAADRGQLRAAPTSARAEGRFRVEKRATVANERRRTRRRATRWTGRGPRAGVFRGGGGGTWRLSVWAMFEPAILPGRRELQYSCDLCGELPISCKRWCCDVCEDFGARANPVNRASIPLPRASPRRPINAIINAHLV